jgi:endonuclease-3 related protein
MDLLWHHDHLLERYGPQGWWPGETRFEVVVGALLTQNTNWKNVEKAIANLKTDGKLDPSSLLGTGDRELETLIRPSGFFRQKASRLKTLTEAYLRFEMEGRAPSREDLLSINGIGKETADSILLYAYDVPIFVIDAYTRRYCDANAIFDGKEYDDYRSFFENNLPRSIPLYKEFHALIVAWGKDPRNRRSP